MEKKEQQEIAEVLFEMGLSFEVIEKITEINAQQYLERILDKNEGKARHD